MSPNPKFAELYAKSGAARYALAEAEFCQLLQQIAAKQLGAGCSEKQQLEFCAGLRLEELALARGCAAGHDLAWQDFLNRYRASLYTSAYAIARNDATGRELADSIYADLYGLRTAAEMKADGVGKRVSKLASYTGRGSLEGWLRTVLAQEFVNRYRKQKRLVSLEEETEAGREFAAPRAEPAAKTDSRLDAATDAALGALATEERFLLASYFLDDRTLADIAKSLGVH